MLELGAALGALVEPVVGAIVAVIMGAIDAVPLAVGGTIVGLGPPSNAPSHQQ